MRTYFKYILSSIFSKGLPRGAKRSGGFTHTPKSLVSGFTLLELLVVMAIATVVTTALVIQNRQWNDQLTVRTQAYELALMIRQAQIYSLAVREDVGGTGDKFGVGYGIYVSQDNLNQYIFFADRNGDKKYGSGEAMETNVFTRGVTIKDVCANSGQCFPGGGALAQVSIVFFRPEPKANITLLNAGGNPFGANSPVTIRLQSLGEKFASVTIEASGQISTQ